MVELLDRGAAVEEAEQQDPAGRSTRANSAIGSAMRVGSWWMVEYHDRTPAEGVVGLLEAVDAPDVEPLVRIGRAGVLDEGRDEVDAADVEPRPAR